jgi:hypothetical protein
MNKIPETPIEKCQHRLLSQASSIANDLRCHVFCESNRFIYDLETLPNIISRWIIYKPAKVPRNIQEILENIDELSTEDEFSYISSREEALDVSEKTLAWLQKLDAPIMYFQQIRSEISEIKSLFKECLLDSLVECLARKK